MQETDSSLYLRISGSRCHSALTSDSLLLALSHRIPEELWSLKLGLKLLAERTKSRSFWSPYIHNLPPTFTLPIFFSAEEIQALQYLPVIHQVEKRCRFLLQFAKEDIPELTGRVAAHEHPFNHYQVDPGALGWAMAAVSSRVFLLNKFGGGGQTLLPLVDMCNHSSAPTGQLLQRLSPADAQPVLLEVVAKRDMERGESLTLDYGPLSNDLLLLDYGFVIPNNPHDGVGLRFDGRLLDAACFTAGVSNGRSFSNPAPWQQAILVHLKLLGPGSSQLVTLGGAELVDGRLLAAVRVMHAQDAIDINTVDFTALQGWGPSPALGPVNEHRVIRTLVGLSMFVISTFPTSLSEDETILGKDDISENLRLAVQFRILKKRHLAETLNSLRQKLTHMPT